VLAASGQMPEDSLNRYEFVAELALSGAIRPVGGMLPAALAIAQQQRQLICASENGGEAGLAGQDKVFVASHLLDVCEHLKDLQTLPHPAHTPEPQPVSLPDLCDVRGQHQARRALEISAAGNHSLLLVGPPGTGKTLLASRLPGLLPPLEEDEALESAAVASICAGHFDIRHWRKRPFRAPHHTASAAALVGGGSNPRPGEISLAHHGVLFLDEFPEFKRHVLEVLREPMETGSITISRANGQAEFPACFQLVAAMNPCKCGYLGDPGGCCHCTSEQILQYRNRVSGPLLDRIDMHVEVPRLSFDVMQGPKGECSAIVRERVTRTRDIQLQRNNTLNSQLTHKHIDDVCALKKSDKLLLQKAMEKLQLSARAYHRILKLARTIADMDGSIDIQTPHLTESINYRKLDRSHF